MGYKATVKERFLHPEGVYPFQVVDCAKATGKFGDQFKWTLETNFERDDDQPPQITYYTPVDITAKNKFGKLLVALGVPLPDEDEDIDTDDLIGKVGRVRLKHSAGADGTIWANVDDLLPAEKFKKKKAAPPPPPVEEDDEEEAVDPFASE